MIACFRITTSFRISTKRDEARWLTYKLWFCVLSFGNWTVSLPLEVDILELDNLNTGIVMEEMLEGDRVHPLLLPSVVNVLVEHLDSTQLSTCARVCKVWRSTIRTQTSPLLNERVLSLVLRHLSNDLIVAADILPFRRVCKLWGSSVPRLRRWRVPCSMENWDNWSFAYFFSPVCQSVGVGNDDFERFATKFGDPDKLPLPSCFTHFTATNNISLSDTNTEEFFEKYGMHVKVLELYRCKWSLEDLRTLLFENCLNLEGLRIVCGIIPGTQVGKGKKVSVPELEFVLHEDPADVKVLERMKDLSLDMNILDTKDNVRAYVEQFLDELLESFPNLERIKFEFRSWYARSLATSFLARDSVKLPRLSVLDHMIDPDLEGVLSLTKKGFPLKKLRLGMRYKDVTVEALHGLLVSLRDTLEELELVFVDYACAKEFPSAGQLCKLKKLELWRFKGQLGFLKELRGLRQLLIGEIDLKGQEIFKQRADFKTELAGVRVEFRDTWGGQPFW